jgi:hypothetical protein
LRVSEWWSATLSGMFDLLARNGKDLRDRLYIMR